MYNNGPSDTTGRRAPVMARLDVPARFLQLGTRRSRLGKKSLFIDPTTTLYYGFVSPDGSGSRNVDRDVVTRSHANAAAWFLTA